MEITLCVSKFKESSTEPTTASVVPYYLKQMRLPLLFQATATLYVPFNGIVRELMYEVDETATKDQPLIMVEVEGEGEEGR